MANKIAEQTTELPPTRRIYSLEEEPPDFSFDFLFFFSLDFEDGAASVSVLAGSIVDFPLPFFDFSGIDSTLMTVEKDAATQG